VSTGLTRVERVEEYYDKNTRI